MLHVHGLEYSVFKQQCILRRIEQHMSNQLVIRRKCTWEATGGRFFCAVCDPTQLRTVPLRSQRFCIVDASPPEPRDAEDVAFIVETLCPGCELYREGKCTYAQKGCTKMQRPVVELAANPLSQCPIWRW